MLREAELLEDAERSREEAAAFARSLDSTGRATRLEELREEDEVPREEEELREEDEVPRAAVPVELRRLSWLEAEVAGAALREELPEVLRETEDPLLRAAEEELRLLAEDVLRLAEDELREEEEEAEDPLLRVVEVLREPEELLDCA